MSPAAPAVWAAVAARLAEKGHQVFSVDRDAVPADQLPAAVVQETAGLLAPGEALRLVRETTPDAVIHLAAIAVPFSAPEDVIFATNTRLAFAEVSAATEVGVPKIVTASSPTVLGYGSPAGWLPPSFPVGEPRDRHRDPHGRRRCGAWFFLDAHHRPAGS